MSANKPARASGRVRGVTKAPSDTVVLYLRVSTLEQAASGLGIEAQRATASLYAERKGLAILDEFRDEGVSAKSLTGRPGALAALSAVREKRAAGHSRCKDGLFKSFSRRWRGPDGGCAP